MINMHTLFYRRRGSAATCIQTLVASCMDSSRSTTLHQSRERPRERVDFLYFGCRHSRATDRPSRVQHCPSIQSLPSFNLKKKNLVLHSVYEPVLHSLRRGGNLWIAGSKKSPPFRDSSPSSSFMVPGWCRSCYHLRLVSLPGWARCIFWRTRYRHSAFSLIVGWQNKPFCYWIIVFKIL